LTAVEITQGKEEGKEQGKGKKMSEKAVPSNIQQRVLN